MFNISINISFGRDKPEPEIEPQKQGADSATQINVGFQPETSRSVVW